MEIRLTLRANQNESFSSHIIKQQQRAVGFGPAQIERPNVDSLHCQSS